MGDETREALEDFCDLMDEVLLRDESPLNDVVANEVLSRYERLRVAMIEEAALATAV